MGQKFHQLFISRSQKNRWDIHLWKVSLICKSDSKSTSAESLLPPVCSQTTATTRLFFFLELAFLSHSFIISQQKLTSISEEHIFVHTLQ